MLEIINGIINSNLEIIVFVISVLIIGILKMMSEMGFKRKFIPLMSIVLGVIFSILCFSEDIKKEILIGIWLGISAVGTYSGIKNTFKNTDPDKSLYKILKK